MGLLHKDNGNGEHKLKCRTLWLAFQVVVKFDESNAQRPHSLGFKALSRQYTVPHIFLEIPEVGRRAPFYYYCRTQPRARNTPMPLQGETQHLKWFVAGNLSVFLFSTTKRLCIRHLGKIREDKWIKIYENLWWRKLYFCWLNSPGMLQKYAWNLFECWKCTLE